MSIKRLIALAVLAAGLMTTATLAPSNIGAEELPISSQWKAEQMLPGGDVLCIRYPCSHAICCYLG